jgi:hypothetical protein
MSKKLDNLMREVEELIGKKALTKLMEGSVTYAKQLQAINKDNINTRLAQAAAESLDKLLLQLPEHKDCDHGVTFDRIAAKGLSAAEVQKRWPRGWGVCPKGCGFDGIAYASAEHFIMGDW